MELSVGEEDISKGVIRKKDFLELSNQINDEIREVLATVNSSEVDKLIEEILKSKKIFIIGVGRVLLSIKCLGKRLSHLGIDVQVVGGLTEKPIGSDDLLLVASGSGESLIPVEISKKAKTLGARIALITSSPQSTIKSLSDSVVHLSTPTKTNTFNQVKSIQPMSTLFDQSLHIFGDVLAIMIQSEKRMESSNLWQYHANLE